MYTPFVHHNPSIITNLEQQAMFLGVYKFDVFKIPCPQGAEMDIRWIVDVDPGT